MAESKTLYDERGCSCNKWDGRLRNRAATRKDGIHCDDEKIKVCRKLDRQGSLNRRSLDDHVSDWVAKKVESGVSETECCLPFLVKAPRLVQCSECGKSIYSEKKLCSVTGCERAYHPKCAKEAVGLSASAIFECPQHACFICKQKGYWHCIRCSIASHTKCAPWPDKVRYFRSQLRRAVCWRHPTDWRFEKNDASTSITEEIFLHLPLPYTEEEFRIDLTWKEIMANEYEPIPYIHINRNIYLTKKLHNFADAGCRCTSYYDTMCLKDCVCRVQHISCSKACHDSQICLNKQFPKGKKVVVVRSESCGWGLAAAEPILEGDFVVEYIGEVIDDDLCAQRLWDMTKKGDKNFYMCRIGKNFTIDPTFKGNTARFMNHSCNPNCKMEKWNVNGETRAGIFATQSIEAGRELTFDYRFEIYGPKVKCCCGAPSCRGDLGAKGK